MVYTSQFTQPHPGQGVLGPAPAHYASQATSLSSAFNTMTLQDPTWHIDTRRNTFTSYGVTCSRPINRGLIQAIPTSLPPQPIGEATKASNLRRIPPGVKGRSHFTYFLYLIVQIRILNYGKSRCRYSHHGTILSIVMRKPGTGRASLAYSIFPESLKTQSCSEFFPLLLPDPQRDGWTDSPQELSILGISSKRPLSKGPLEYYTKTDNRPPYGEMRQGLEELLAKHQEESARRSTEMEVWIKKLQENAEIKTRNQNASLKNLETQIEQLTEELRSRKEKSEQTKVVIVDHEGPSSPKKIKNLHGISFLSDSQEENTNDQLHTKESNPGHFTLPCTIDNFNFYAMADLGASVNVLPRNIFEYLELTNLSKIEMLVEMADMRKKAPLGIVRDILVKIDKFLFPFDFVILDQTPNSTVILGRPFLATVHAYISVFEKEISVGIDQWVIDQFTEALDPDKNPLERCLDEYNWKDRCKNKDWWYDYWYEDEEKIELGNEDYDPPMVHIETFKVTKYKFNNGCSLICVSGENNETLSLGRKNGSRFRKMIMEEMDEVLGNDEEDSDNKT
ncbi:reverse transcriptase domain-containing protein [Tanacetum coccineum]